MSDEDEHDEPMIHGFSIPIGIVREDPEALDRRHMEAEDIVRQVYDLLDSLTKENLLALRRIFRLTRKGLVNVDGQVVSILRLKYHVDPESGLTAEESAEQALTRRTE